MELRPDINKLMRREIYTLLTISVITLVLFLIIQVLVVNLNPEVDNEKFVKYVWSWVAGALIVLWVFLPWLFYLWIINLKYFVEEDHLVIHKGIITKKMVNIPYSAVTDFTLSRSLYERWLEIGTILIQTAGQSAQAGEHEGKLTGLIEFDSLYATLRTKIKTVGGLQVDQITPVTNPASNEQVLQAILEEVKRIGRKLG